MSDFLWLIGVATVLAFATSFLVLACSAV